MLQRQVRAGLAFCFAAALAVAATGCGGSDSPTDPDPDPDPDPATISISIDPSSATVEQGGSLTVSGTATVGGSFSGDVTFTVAGLPAGVTISVGTVTVSGGTGTADITLAVAASVAPGTYNGTVTASGSGVSDSVAFSLTVTGAAAFSLGSIDDVTIQQGMSDTRNVIIERSGGFADAVALSVEGAPSGLTATPDPASTTGTTSTLTIEVGGAVATGTYTLTVRGTATGLPDATATFDAIVTAATAGTQITVDFSVCSPDDRPVWVAVKDGMAGEWSPVTGSNDAYTFTVMEDVVGFANVSVGSLGSSDVSINYFTTPEAVEAAASGVCDSSSPTGKLVNGTAANVVGPTNLTLGGATTLVAVDGPFDIAAVPDGAVDLIGYSAAFSGGSDRMVILRDQNIADGGDIGTIDFAADGFDVGSATITVGGLAGGEMGLVSGEYATVSAGAMCAVAPLATPGSLASSFSLSGAPESERGSDEYHVAGITTSDGGIIKQVKEAFQALADRTVAMPPDLPAPAFTDVTGGAAYLRLQAELATAAEYNTTTFFSYYSDAVDMTVFATAGVMSGGVTLTMPDFTGLSGWDDAWAIPASATGIDYLINAAGQTSINALCSDGGRTINATIEGSYN